MTPMAIPYLRTLSRYNFSTQSYTSKVYVSDDNGNPFTWSNIVEYLGKVWFTNDEINSG